MNTRLHPHAGMLRYCYRGFEPFDGGLDLLIARACNQRVHLDEILLIRGCDWALSTTSSVGKGFENALPCDSSTRLGTVGILQLRTRNPKLKQGLLCTSRRICCKQMLADKVYNPFIQTKGFACGSLGCLMIFTQTKIACMINILSI